MRSMKLLLSLVIVIIYLAPSIVSGFQVEFSMSTPEREGIKEASIGRLKSALEKFVDSGQIVGGEILVVKNRKIVCHHAAGWKDRENRVRLEPGAIYCVRSMTKPLIGCLVMRMVDQGRIKLSDPVSKYLPSFDTDRCRKITINQLLSHRSGLPLSVFADQKTKLEDFENVHQVADAGARLGTDFEPGTKFQYSDQGSDTLTSLLEHLTQKPVPEMLAQSILDPIGMDQTMALVDPSATRSQKIPVLYLRKTNEWKRTWDINQGPLFSYFLGSQSLYSSATDYAKFLTVIMDGGRFGDSRWLAENSVQAALEPVSTMNYPNGFSGYKTMYGLHWMVYQSRTNPSHCFYGHGGSDGTAAYFWPDKDLIVIYMTQSRRQTTISNFERCIFDSLLNSSSAPAEGDSQLAPMLGEYLANYGVFKNETFTVSESAGKLSIDIPSQAVFELKAPDKNGKWYLELTDTIAVSFVRNSDERVTSLIVHQAGYDFELPRKGVEMPIEVPLAQLKPLLGTYRSKESGRVIEVLIQNNHLAAETKGQGVIEFLAPGADSRWAMRAKPSLLQIEFNKDKTGGVKSLLLIQAGITQDFERVVD